MPHRRSLLRHHHYLHAHATATATARMKWGQLRAFLVTFLAYTAIHLVRKPASVLKSVLHPPQSETDPSGTQGPGWAPFNRDVDASVVAAKGFVVRGAGSAWDGEYICAPRNPLLAAATNSKDNSDVPNNAKRRRQLEPCLTFVRVKPSAKSPGNADTPAPLLMRVRNSPTTCERWLASKHPREACWVLRRPSPTTPNANPAFVQPWGGVLPRFFQRSEANLDEKAWRVWDPATQAFEVDDAVSVEPRVSDGRVLLGVLDTVFLSAYTVGLVVSGWVADRVDVRRFLAVGMVGAGVASVMIGMAHAMKVHNFAYFCAVNLVAGACQSVGWPCVLTVMSRWFPRDYPRRGLVMGV